jgi:putative transposase
MPSTHTSLHYHIVFSTKERRALIDKNWRGRLHAYLGGTIRELNGIPVEIGGVGDHVHLLIGLKPTHSVAEVVREIKIASSKWVHQEIKMFTFSWQDGYGAFTVSPTGIDGVSKYIANQEEHHRVKTFEEEYREFLLKAGIEFDERFLW